MTDPVPALAAQMGILPAFTDLSGKEHVTSRDTQLALLGAMGVPTTGEAELRETLEARTAAASERMLGHFYISEPGQAPGIPLSESAEWRIVTEDGKLHEGRGAECLPTLPLGLHRIETGQESAPIITAPRQLPLPPRGWGVTMPLAGLRDAATGGIGDYTDLATAAAAIARAGGGFAGLNPVHAGFPYSTEVYSPYTPSHRQRLSVIHIATGTESKDRADLVNYRTAIPEKLSHLHTAFKGSQAENGDTGFKDFRRREGAALDRFALYQALSQRHGPYWRDWPDVLRDPAGPAARQAAERHADELAFHCWCQYQAETQLARAAAQARAAGAAHGLYLDLAVGTHPSGAETWEDRDSFALGASLGAPPDDFAPQGQNWNLAAFDPQGLVSTGFTALSRVLRKQFQFAGLLRIDHIVGFERAFWMPRDPNVPGAYVAMPRDAMLAVVRAEAARAGAFVVGEDLGIIPETLRHALKASGILGYRVAMFEDDDGRFRAPQDYDDATLATFSTHDLPTWRGWRAGRDIAARRRIGLSDADAAAAAQTDRAAKTAALDTALTAASVTRDPASPDAITDFLGQTKSRLVAIQAEDIFGMEDQANLPGTVESYPNWRRRLPLAPSDWAGDERLKRTGDILRRAGRSGGRDDRNDPDPTD